jgi:hypothetical protein
MSPNNTISYVPSARDYPVIRHLPSQLKPKKMAHSLAASRGRAAAHSQERAAANSGLI